MADRGDADRQRSLRSRRRSVASEAGKLIEPAHGDVVRQDDRLMVYCARCRRWQFVEVDAQLALQVHEVVDHK